MFARSAGSRWLGRFIARWIVIASLLLGAAACTRSGDGGPIALQIDSMEPRTGAPGTLVTLTGSFSGDVVIAVCELPLEGLAFRSDGSEAAWIPALDASPREAYESVRGRIPALTASTCTVQVMRDGTVVESEGLTSSFTIVDPASVPTAPQGVSVTDGDGVATLTFDPPEANGSAITNYEIQLDDGPWRPLSPSDAEPPLTVVGLTNGVAYEARVRAVNAEGVGPSSETVALRPFTLPSAPTNLSAVAQKGGIDVSFDAPDANGRPITNYAYRLTVDGVDGAWLPLSPTDSASPISIGGLSWGVTYDVSLRAVNEAGMGPPSEALTGLQTQPEASLETAFFPTFMVEGAIDQGYLLLSGAPSIPTSVNADFTCGRIDVSAFEEDEDDGIAFAVVFLVPSDVDVVTECTVTVGTPPSVGASLTVTIPVYPYPELDGEEMAVGMDHVLLRDASGGLFTWGDATYGQLGPLPQPLIDPLASSVSFPLPVTPTWPEDRSITSLAAGFGTSFVTLDDGSMWGWGSNYKGRLGINSTASQQSTPTKLAFPDGVSVVRVASAGNTARHTMALDSQGRLWVWGDNRPYKQLGLPGSTSSVSAPVLLTDPFPAGVSFSDVAVGINHSLALAHDGFVWAWGSNVYGQLGVSSTAVELPPVSVTDALGGSPIVDVEAGDNVSMVRTADGAVWGWGATDVAQLVAPSAARSSCATGSSSSTECERSPVLVVSSSENVKELSVGAAFAIERRADGSLLTWGANSKAELGSGSATPTYRASPLPVTPFLPSGVSIDRVAAAASAGFVLDSDGNVWSWGDQFDRAELGQPYLVGFQRYLSPTDLKYRPYEGPFPPPFED